MLETVIKTNQGLEHKVIFGVRPEDIKISSTIADFSRKIDISELLGDEYYLHFSFGGNDFLSKVSIDEIGDMRQEKHFLFVHKKIHLFDKDSERTIF